MMNLTAMIKKSARNVLVAAGLTGVISGCTTINPEQRIEYSTISGEPLSAEAGIGHSHAYFAGTLRIGNGKVILFYRTAGRPKLLDAAAAINSEINDGDNELIELNGFHCKDNKFLAYNIVANGLSVDIMPDELTEFEITMCLGPKNNP